MTDLSVSEALRSQSRLVVIEAPAGCGKTHQAAEYARWLGPSLTSGRMLILTHTHAACDVFRARTRAIANSVFVSTIDGLIAQIAGAYHLALDLPPDVVAWAHDQHQNGFEQLARRVATLLQSSPALLSILVARFPVVVCDEHQDANSAQHNVVMKLLEGGSRLRIFADPVQAIFARGAEHAEYTQRWEALQAEADRFELLDLPHRWTEGSPALGRWILGARDDLKNGGQLNLRRNLPDGLSLIDGSNIAPRRGGFQLDRDAGRALNRTVDGPDRIMILSSQTETVRSINAYLGRRIPIWEGHTRAALLRLVSTCQDDAGNPPAIATAFKDFVQATVKGFSNTAFANRLLAEVDTNCARRCRGLPARLQELARIIIEHPNHVGVGRALILLQGFMQEDMGFQSLRLDLTREYRDATLLQNFEDARLGLAEITQRRNASHAAIPIRCISTIHKAKGHQSQHAVLVPCDRAHFGQTQEKRNLLYVAISRASHSLTIQVSAENPSPLVIYP